jgi:nitroreductase
MVHAEARESPEAIARCVSAVVRSRRSVRAFKPDPLRRELVEGILEDAASAPSGANIQPWRVYGLGGVVKDELAHALVHASRAEAAAAPAHFPDPLPELFRTRLADFGVRYCASLGIDRDDVQMRARQTERNSRSSAHRWASSSASTAGRRRTAGSTSACSPVT